jgi:hypothetical protein
MSEITYETRPLVAFLYLLMLETVTPGRVSELPHQVESMPAGVTTNFANLHLRDYAIEVADALERGKPLRALAPASGR